MQPPMSAPPNFQGPPPPGVHQQGPPMPMPNMHQPGPSQMPPGMSHMPVGRMPQQQPLHVSDSKSILKSDASGSQQMIPHQFQQPGAPPASPQIPIKEENSGTQTAELISFD